MKAFCQMEVEEAVAEADGGGQALHLHRIIVDRDRAPRCFVAAIDRGEPIAHLFDRDEKRLIATAKGFGVKVIFIDRRGTESQHIDLCGGPMWKAIRTCENQEKVKAILDELKEERIES